MDQIVDGILRWFESSCSRHNELAYSAAEDGRVPFVSADDIAAAAMAALIHERSFNSDFVLTGSQAISYDEVAERISKRVGRTISHHRLSAGALGERYRALGLGSVHAQMLAAMDTAIAAGAEDRVTGCVEQLIGRPPIAFGAFVEANASEWYARS